MSTLFLQSNEVSASRITSGGRRDRLQRPSYSVHMDAIRALAAFVVFAGHARMLFFGDHARQGESLVGAVTTPSVSTVSAMGMGHHAVIVFFVLSGFLVGNSAWKAIRSGQWSWGRYLTQRATRLWIVLLPALTIGGYLDRIGITFLSHNHSIYTGPPGQGMVAQNLHNALTIKVLAGNALFLQMIQVPTYGTNAALSTLANEFWYYLIFPMLILLCVRTRPLWVKAAYAALVLGLLAFIGPAISALFAVWLSGFVVSILPLSIRPGFRRAFAIGCFIQFVAVNVGIRIHPLDPLAADGLLGLSFSLFLYSLLHKRDPVQNRAYQDIATWASNFSYTLYLFHLPFVTFLTALAVTPWHPWPLDVYHIGAAALLVAVTYGYSWLMYWCFERNTPKVRLYLAAMLSGRRRNEQVLHSA
jgi:peptidoglycan/LPS O-acetylase OafA/YrhL